MTEYTWERKLASKFPVLKNNRDGIYSSERLLTYGGIINASSLERKGGLYHALTIVLALYYTDIEKANFIENLLADIEELSELRFDEISNEKLQFISERLDEVTR